MSEKESVLDKVNENIEVELYEGYKEKVNTDLFNDFEFISELSQAQRDGDIANLVSLTIALVGGQPTYEKIKAYSIKKYGRVDMKFLSDVVTRIAGALPKGGDNSTESLKWSLKF